MSSPQKDFFPLRKKTYFRFVFDLSVATYSSCCATKRTNHEEHVDQKQDMSMLIDGMFSQGRTYEEFLHEQFFITPHFGAKYERSTAPSSNRYPSTSGWPIWVTILKSIFSASAQNGMYLMELLTDKEVFFRPSKSRNSWCDVLCLDIG